VGSNPTSGIPAAPAAGPASLVVVCGRFSLSDTNPVRLRARFALPESVEVDERPRFNVAPTDPVLAIRLAEDGRRELGRLRWGLLPGGWAEHGNGGPLINARAETLAEQPAFREAFQDRRCLVPADGFYEWRVGETGKQAVWISRADSELFAFAGIWATLERPDAEPLHSCAIVTCEPNAEVRPIHDRMPVILDRNEEGRWLDPRASEADLRAALRPLPDGELELREVSDAVNDVRQDGPHLLEPPLRLF
jgi:putative SOS response-associated peptidase YedK